MVFSGSVLHFARDQLYWYCRKVIYSEIGEVTKQQGLLFDSGSLIIPDISTSREVWVRDYSKQNLSHQNDKLAALAGLTNIFQRSMSKFSTTEPVVGLWLHDLHFDHLWYPALP